MSNTEFQNSDCLGFHPIYVRNMKKKIKISKLDAAKRHLETAIRLYFNYGDPIAIHTLACAAHGILSDLNEEHKGNRNKRLEDYNFFTGKINCDNQKS